MDTELLTQQRILFRNPSIFASRVDDELIMMDEKQGTYFGLNSVARRIWEILDTPHTHGALLNQLVAGYEIELEQCKAEVNNFLSRMIEHRLIFTGPPPDNLNFPCLKR